MDARQIDFDGGSFADLAVDFNVSTRLFDEAIHLGKSKPGAVADILRRKEWVEGLRDDVGGHAAAIVCDGQHHILSWNNLNL